MDIVAALKTEGARLEGQLGKVRAAIVALNGSGKPLTPNEIEAVNRAEATALLIGSRRREVGVAALMKDENVS